MKPEEMLYEFEEAFPGLIVISRLEYEPAYIVDDFQLTKFFEELRNKILK